MFLVAAVCLTTSSLVAQETQAKSDEVLFGPSDLLLQLPSASELETPPLTTLAAACDYAEQLIAREDFGTADKYLTQASEKFADDPDRHRLLFVRARCGMLAGQFDVAIEYCSQAIAMRPDNASYFTFRGQAYSGKGGRWMEKAIEDFETALKLIPNRVESMNALAEAYLHVDRLEDALTLLRNACKQHPQDSISSSNLVECLRLLKDFEAALAESDRGLKLTRKAPQTYFNRSQLLCDMGRLSNAIAACDAGLKTWPSNHDLLRKLGRVRMQYLDGHSAFAGFDRGERNRSHLVPLRKINSYLASNDEPLLLYQRGMEHLALGKFELACADLRAVVERLPDFAEAWYELGRVLTELKLSKEAANAFRQSSRLLPELSDPMLFSRPLPDDEGDREILLALQSGDPTALLNQMPSTLRPYIDDTEVKRRFQRMSRHWPPLAEAGIAESTPHPKVGDQQKTLTLEFANPGDGKIEVTVARSAKGEFLGIEFQSGRMTLGTLTALKGVSEFPKITTQMIRAIGDGDPESFRNAMPYGSMSVSNTNRFVASTQRLIGKPKQVRFLESVIELPEYSENQTTLSALALMENQDSMWLVFQVRFVVGDTLALDGLKFGNSVNLRYSSRLKTRDEEFARAHVSSNVDDFYALVHFTEIEGYGDRQLRGLLNARRGKVTGDFVEIADDTFFSRVQIDQGDFERHSTFDAIYKDEVLAMEVSWYLDLLDAFRSRLGCSSQQVYGHESIGQSLIARAQKDLTAYMSGSAETILSMLKGYSGFDSQSIESLTPMAEKLNRVYGELKTIEFLDASFDDSTGAWTLSFGLDCAKTKATASATYTITNSEPNISNVRADVQETDQRPADSEDD